MTDFTPALNPQQSRTGKPDVRWRQLMFNHFLRTSAWLALHILLLVGYLTLVFAMGVNWLTSLAIFFVAGLAIGWIMGLSGAWGLAMILQAFIVLLTGLIAVLFNAIL